MVMVSTHSSPLHISTKATPTREKSFGYFNFDSNHQQEHHNQNQNSPITPTHPGSIRRNSSSSNTHHFSCMNNNSTTTSSRLAPEVKVTLVDVDNNNNNGVNTDSNESNLIADARKGLIELKSPTSPISSASSFSMPQRLTSGNGSKTFDISDSNVMELNTINEFKELKQDQTCDTLIIDTRPFNQYSTSRVQGALSICVPSTLLKRSSFHLANIFKTMTSEQQNLIDAHLKSANNLNIVFYDSNSTTEQCSTHLYQIIKKFQMDIKEYNQNKQIELLLLNKGFTSFLHQEGVSETDSIFDFKKLRSTNSGDANSFSDFMLPSANPTSSFLLSMKKNQHQIDQNDSELALNIPMFNNATESLPKWMHPYLSPKSGNMVTSNFVKIENSENARIESVVSKKIHSPSICSPNCLCPHCDQLNYNLLDGSEHGFKNRYPNILPYEHSRVKLVQSPCMSPNANGINHNKYFPKISPSAQHKLHLTTPNQTNTTHSTSPAAVQDDYFNANFINVPQINKEARYIATQAPLPSTIDDFWKVVWHNNSEVIISLTNLSEYGIKKADIYWENSSRVELLEEVENYSGLKNLTMRKIQLKRRDQSRIITQLHFQDWPDHGVADYGSLLKLSQIKDSLLINKQSPVVVHCSAGCGRTGVFITIDLIVNSFKQQQEQHNKAQIKRSSSMKNKNKKKHCLDEFRNDEQINIWDTENDLIYYTVQQLRKQRISMVQSLKQFIFCYETVFQFFSTLEKEKEFTKGTF